MNIGIITIIDNNNYGNRLQNYATQEIVKSLHLNPITIQNQSYKNDKKYYFFRLIKHRIFNFKRSNTFTSINDIKLKRQENFRKFNNKIIFSKEEITAYKTIKDFDYYLVGSDQVWNPEFGRLRYVDLLAFAENNKRISFSASFGISHIPQNMKATVSRELKKFKSISVREDVGKKIVENLTNRKDVEVLVDPTMLLTEAEWVNVCKKPKMLKTNKFILNYFLGELSKENEREIERIAKEYNCEIINILDKNSPFYACGPSEFLYLEKNAFLICTDSFHSSVFAILFRKPFLVFERLTRSSMNYK